MLHRHISLSRYNFKPSEQLELIEHIPREPDYDIKIIGHGGKINEWSSILDMKFGIQTTL